MNYSNMIKTEDTDSRYSDWRDYRLELTSYINKALDLTCEKNSWVAIWGAGGCNDIDILELSKSYRLLLIDQDVDKLAEVRERLDLSPDICKVADVGFWNVTEDDYEMFQALFMDGAPLSEIESYFQDLVNKMLPPVNLEAYKVEASVVVGLTSQLNARFAALLYLYKDKVSHVDMEKIYQILVNINKLATEKLYVSLRQITKKLVITGYEIISCYSQEEADKEKIKLESVFEDGLTGGKYLSGNEEAYIEVAGNEFWHKIIYKAILMDKLEDIGLCQIINWPFSEDKYYPMLMVSLTCV